MGIRRIHRWLGVLLGVQFLFWTLGGLYFSWSNLDEVHCDPFKRTAPLFSPGVRMVSPNAALDSLQKAGKIDSLIEIRMVEVLGQPVYQIQYLRHGKKQVQLANAQTGELRGPLSQAESIEVARSRYNGKDEPIRVEWVDSVGRRSEYRDDPLPACAVTFNAEHPVTLWVAIEYGTVMRYRNTQWRIFDWLWMMHTMDYEGRDNISNWLLRGFSILGFLTVLSGLSLFFITMRRKIIF